MGIVTVKDLMEHFLDIIGVTLPPTEEYEKVMDYYDKLVAVPYFEYKQLMYAQTKLDEIMAGDSNAKENN
jgi:hypothetical protein